MNFVFDPEFPDQPITVDLEDVGFEQALNAIASVGHTFHRVLDSRVVMVMPDTPDKRRDYEQQVVKTFFLSNADLKETIDLLRIVLGARRVAPLPGANALTINDTPDKVAAAERIVDIVDKQRAEVMVEVEILEVNRGAQGVRDRDHVAAGGSGILGAIFPRGHDHGDGARRERQPALRPHAAPHHRRQPLQGLEPPGDRAARRHLPAAAERHLVTAAWPTRSCARWRARPRRPDSATRSRCR